MNDQPIGKIKLGVELEGTSFGNNLDEINAKIKQAESSMKANLKAFDSAGKSYDGLNQKVKDLTTVMSGQDAKIVALNKRRDEAIEKYGKESKQVINLNTQINNATAKYNGFEKQLNTAKKELAYASTEVNALTKEMKDNEKATQEEVKALKLAGDEAGALELQQQGLEKQLDLTKRATVEQQKVVESLTQEFGANSTEVENAKSNLEKLGRQTKITETQLSGVKSAGENLDLSDQIGKTTGGIDGADIALGSFVGALGANIVSKGLEKISELAGEIANEFGLAKESYEEFLVATRGDKSQTSKLENASANAYTAMGGERTEFNEASEIILSLSPEIDETQLQKQTQMAVAYAKATGSDVSESIAGAYKVSSEFKIPVEEAYNAMQTMAKNVGDQKHEIADQMNEYARYYAQNGSSVEDMTTKIVNGYQNGAYQVDKFNDLYKEMGLTIQDTEKMGKLVGDLGIGDIYEKYKDGSATVEEVNTAVLKSISAIEDPQQRLLKYQEVYGTLAEDNGLKVLDSFSKQGEGVKITTGEMDKLISLTSHNSPWEALKRNTANLFTPFAEGASKMSSQLTGFIKEMFKPRKIQWIDDLRNFLEPYLMPIINDVKAIFSDLFKSISDFWATNGSQFMVAFKNFLVFIQPLLNIVVDIVRGFIQGIADLVKGVVKALQGVVQIFTGIFTGDFKLLWEGLKNLFFGAIQAIWGYMNSLFFGKILKGIGGFVKAIPQSISGMWTSIRTFFTNGISGATSSVSNFVANIPRKIVSMVTNAKNSITGMWSSIKTAFSNGISNVVTKMKNLPRDIANGIKNNAGKVVDAFKSMFKKAQQAIKKPVNMVIGGANWVLKKFGAKEIPTWNPDEKYAKGTPKGGHKGGSALVNDGNGAEMVIMPNGQSFIPKGKNVLIPNAPVGMHVMNAQDTALAMGRATPTFAYKNGTSWWDDTKNFVGNMGKWAKEKVSNVWDFVSNPSKLVEIALSKFVDFGDAAGFALDASKGLVGKAKDSMLGWAKDIFSANDQGGVFDGSINSRWGVFSYLKDIADKAISKFGEGLRITSGYRAGDPNYHGKRQAIDIALPASMNGSSKNKTIANWVYDNFRKQVAYVITNGKVRDRSGFSGTGKSGNWVGWPSNDHYDHVHINGLLNSSNVTKAVGKTYANSVEKWRSIASQALQMEGQYSSANLNALMNQIRTESNGNQYAINDWDINAKNGTPSKGLLQVIDPTFRAYARSGYNSNIYDPLSNILASIRYARSRYGSLTSAYRGVGYANGGFITKQHLAMVGEGNNPEVVIPLANAKRSRAMELLAKTKNILGDKDAIIVNNNNDNNDLKSLESKFDMLISIATALLNKEVAVNLDGRKLNKAMEDIKTRNAIQKNRGGGLITA